MIYILIAVGIFLLEYRVKNWVEKTKPLGKPEDTRWKLIKINRHHNRGTAGEKFVKNQGLIAIIALVFTLLCTVFFFLTLGHSSNRFLKIGLAFLLGGAFSNTYDRLKRKFVVDYIQFQVPEKLSRYIFNLADFAILIGALLVGITMERK
jgi:signal peptidase II